MLLQIRKDNKHLETVFKDAQRTRRRNDEEYPRNGFPQWNKEAGAHRSSKSEYFHFIPFIHSFSKLQFEMRL
jgi:hypothetical protein